MPRLSAWMVRLSLVSLVLGALVGGLLLAGVPVSAPHGAALRQAHLDLMLFGWLVQFVLGVAYWMLPRYAAKPERGSPRLAWGAFALFQGGLALAVVGQALARPSIAPAAGRLLLAGATFVFLGLLWGRAKPFAAR
ncbi:MAG TPA: cbb3-type cytochrome c oxidase subunit I [Gemmatimonadales bacterium]|nr:cbb3-type cytochrome c oxidase subunit I [Gemmatimonadales bacterium]